MLRLPRVVLAVVGVVMKSLKVRVAVSTAVLAVGAALVVAGPAQAGYSAVNDTTQAADFYTPPSPLPAGKDGDVIRSEPMTVHLGLSAKAQRIMYLTRDAKNQPIAVTGTVLTPNTPWLGLGKRPVIGYAVGTQGLGDQCAASKQLETGLEYEGVYIEGLLMRGYGVVVTDYQGLGTPGEHTYVNRAAQGHAVLDSVRAAQRLPDAGLPADGPVVTFGYSQGGGASASAAELQPTYAPELKLKGAYAGAVPAELKSVGKSLDGSYAVALLGYAVSGLEAAYPDQIDLDQYLNDQGKQLVEQGRKECLVESLALHAFTKSETLTKDGRPVSAYMDEEPFNTLVNEQKLGNRKPSAPVLVLHSTLDDIVPFEQGKQMAKDWCSKGAKVQFKSLELPTHIAAIPNTAPYVFPWLEGVVAGVPQLSNCGTF
jgi:pimeloyl-ACP methyl ester carboxylesterase